MFHIRARHRQVVQSTCSARNSFNHQNTAFIIQGCSALTGLLSERFVVKGWKMQLSILLEKSNITYHIRGIINDTTRRLQNCSITFIKMHTSPTFSFLSLRQHSRRHDPGAWLNQTPPLQQMPSRNVRWKPIGNLILVHLK